LDHPAKEVTAREGFEKLLSGKNVKELTERALKYDLTIPFARFIAMNHGVLVMPFKRYQIQPVWRADRPQKGRYREFYQCDADVAGSRSLINEAEFISIYQEVFFKLNIQGCEIRINSRKILSALAEQCGGQHQLTPITIAIDKLDKIGPDKVKEELLQRGLSSDQIDTIEKYLSLTGSNNEKLIALKTLLPSSSQAGEGIEEIEYLLQVNEKMRSSNDRSTLLVDLTLARGLNYYTGVIFEVKAPSTVTIGSIGGGGRYDDLTGTFGVEGIPGAGISFGVDRIYDVMEELQLFPDSVEVGSKVLFFNLGAAEILASFSLAKELRKKGIACELFHEQAKFDKQFKYAEKKNIPYVVIIGSTELEENICTVKNIKTGKQDKIGFAELGDFLVKA
nr:histidine--tRNA ligase [Flavisolibacter sp.]